MKEYRLEKRPKSRSTKEQALLNNKVLEERVNELRALVNMGAKGVHDSVNLMEKVEKGEIAYTSIDTPNEPLVFSSDLKKVTFKGSSLTLKTNNLEGTMLGILVNSAIRDSSNWVSHETIIEAMDADCSRYEHGLDYVDSKTVRNTRDRLNRKFEKAFGIKTVIEGRPPKTYEGGCGRSRFRLKCEIKK